jgi:hypothetical protein
MSVGWMQKFVRASNHQQQSESRHKKSDRKHYFASGDFHACDAVEPLIIRSICPDNLILDQFSGERRAGFMFGIIPSIFMAAAKSKLPDQVRQALRLKQQQFCP